MIDMMVRSGTGSWTPKVYVLHESDTAYRAHFDAGKRWLSMDNGV